MRKERIYEKCFMKMNQIKYLFVLFYKKKEEKRKCFGQKLLSKRYMKVIKMFLMKKGNSSERYEFYESAR